MPIKIYNTLTRKKEELIPLEPNKISMYVCGPTVYDYFHVGNARPFVMYDIFRRYLIYRGFEVKYVMNLTDVDDKIIKKANEQGVSASEIAEKYTQAFFEDIEKLGIKRADHYPRATESIPNMIKLIEILIEKGMAYVVDGDVFYEVAKFKDYGKLSGKNIDELKSGARIDVDERKKSPLDFALWKAAKPDEPYWESPWGKGRPGWHIECSVMSMTYLGETIDIHAGGSDLIFPHHENEIAQSEGATGKPFARYWMHNGFLNIEGEKMSKSLGNFFTAREIMEKYHPAVIRMFFLLKHYRSPINFSEERIREAEQALKRISTAMENIELALSEVDVKNLQKNGELSAAMGHLKQHAIEELDDDFNTAGALASVFDFVREANLILNNGSLSADDYFVLFQIKETIEEFDQFLSILSYSEARQVSVPEAPLIELLIDVRKKLRENKQWALADEIRDRLFDMGIELKDRPGNTIWQRKRKS
ncbi:MAG: cysteine--tRNA ligase [Calditrichaeota bacterium]|nr:cysteine--tRNA ligase [Calditrichota bacterium]